MVPLHRGAQVVGTRAIAGRESVSLVQHERRSRPGVSTFPSSDLCSEASATLSDSALLVALVAGDTAWPTEQTYDDGSAIQKDADEGRGGQP